MEKYYIILQGCDDFTRIPIKLDRKEVLLIQELSNKSKEISGYECMPILILEKAEE